MPARFTTPVVTKGLGWMREVSSVAMTVAALIAILIVVWSTRVSIAHLHDYQDQLMENEGRSVSEAIGHFVSERARLLSLFAEQHRDRLTRFLASNEDPALQRELDELIAKNFPNYFAFTLRDSHSRLVPDDLGEFVGAVCRADMEQFWENRADHNIDSFSDYRPFIHPQGENYHFDMMTLWEATGGDVSILFISFHPKQLAHIIASFELPGHQVVLVREDQPNLIELTAEGTREALNRDFHLTPDELGRVYHSLPIEHTKWLALIMPEAGFMEEREWVIYRRAGIQIFGIALFWVGAMWLTIRTLRQKQQAYVTINEQAERLLRSQQVAHVGSWDWDITTGDLEWTDEIYSIFGRSRDDFGSTHENFLQCIHPEDREKAATSVGNAVERNAPYDIQHRILLPNGTVGYIHEKGKVYHDHTGRAVRMLGIVHDVTDRVMLDRSKAEFIATASHELRTPLTSIKGSLALLTGGAVGKLPDNVKTMLKIAHNNVDRLISLVDDILDLEKLQSERMDFHFEDIDLTDLVTEGVSANLGYANKLDVNFKIEHPLSDIKVHCDKNRILQVLTNFLSNATKFSPSGSTVSISTSFIDGMATITVSDQGIGISKEFQARMFDRFTQEDSTDQRAQGGTGLGLSICKNIIEKHHGEISFKTNADKGSTFSFTIPTASKSG